MSPLQVSPSGVSACLDIVCIYSTAWPTVTPSSPMAYTWRNVERKCIEKEMQKNVPNENRNAQINAAGERERENEI